MKIVIVGAGAMGCMFAALLRRCGQSVYVLEHDAAACAAVSGRGIVFEGADGSHDVVDIPVQRDAASIGRADYVLMCVKSFDTGKAAAGAAACVDAQTAVVTLQNGIGNVETLSRCFAGRIVLAGTTAHGATLLGPGHVRHAGTGDTAIGCVHPEGRRSAERLCDIFEAAGITVRIADDLQSLLWEKLLVNIGINPLAALLGIANGRILELEHTRAVMHRAVREGAAVAAAHGIPLDPDEAVARAERVCRATQANLCSMLQDLRAGRMTEIDYLNGAVVAGARKTGCPVPVNTMLTELVKARQMLAGSPPDWHSRSDST